MTVELDRDRLADVLQKAWDGCFSLPPIDIYGDEGSAIIAAILADIEAQGFVLVPRVATEGLLVSMAIRDDHGLGVAGYYDQKLFQHTGITHAQRLQSAVSTMRKLHEEVVGAGFYIPEKEADYANAMIEAAQQEGGDE